ncbi:MAG: recombinase family protein [Sphingobacteriales bacterium JAD_PAG50586_3]|nr:MAG: recombinase family protein [Sphingobacteriales bacterium JAD_PAG50586_3]
MKQKYQKGIFFGRPPLGYNLIIANGQKSIIINEHGRLLAKAFKWKAQKQLPTFIIGEKLRGLGVDVSDKHLSRVFRNVFYCGLLSNKMLGQEIMEGQNWEPLVSKEIFLKANEVLENAHVKYESRAEDQNLPLKQVVKCDKCKNPMTGYVARKKGIYYYKCNTVGCKSNKNAMHMNSKFFDFLDQYKIEPTLHPLIKQQLIANVKNCILDKVSDKDDFQSR